MAKSDTVERRSAYHHGDLRGALILATRQLIEEKGIDHFSVSDACRLAGVSTAAPYKHFKSKEGMVEAAVVDAMERHHAGLVEDIAKTEKGSMERIVAMGLNYIGFAVSEPAMFKLRFGHNEPEDSATSVAGQEVYLAVQEEVRAALREPVINDRVLERSFMLWSFVHGLSYLSMNPNHLDKSGSQPLEPLLHNVARRVLAD
ncbi:MAG: TetR/AcrR family transcriptional regulator [Pseudomonadota bacterium]